MNNYIINIPGGANDTTGMPETIDDVILLSCEVEQESSVSAAFEI